MFMIFFISVLQCSDQNSVLDHYVDSKMHLFEIFAFNPLTPTVAVWVQL